MRVLFLLIWYAMPALAQTPVLGNLEIRGRLDAAQALSTAPARLVTSLPATCTQGQAVMLTTAPLTEWLHVCTSPNVWTRQATVPGWNAITGKPGVFPPEAHEHAIQDVTGLQTALNGKEPGITPGPASQVWLGNKTWGNVQWDDVASKPPTFPPHWHEHPIANIYGLQDALDGKASSSHNHDAAYVSLLGSYSNPSWLNSVAGSKITGAVPQAEALAAVGASCPDGQASRGIDAAGNATGCWTPSGGSGGPVQWTDILNKPAFSAPNAPDAVVQRDSGGNIGVNFVYGTLQGDSVGTHYGNVSGDLNGNASTVTNGVYTTGSYANPSWLASLAWSKLTGVPSTFTPSAHSHPISDVTGLQTALDGKAGTSHNHDSSYASLSGSYNNPAWITGLAGSKISGTVVNATNATQLTGPSQINFGFGGDPNTVIPNTTFNNIWRAHGYGATVQEVACWTDTGTVSLTIRRSDGTNMHSALTCSSTGASTSTISTPAVSIGQGLGFITASASSVKNLSVSIKYTRSY